MKAILVDPGAPTVTEADYDGDLESLYRIIGCSLVDHVHLDGDISDGSNGMFVNDEGLLRDPPPEHFFTIETEFGRTDPIPGKALIAGADSDGNPTDTTMTPEEVKARIKWLTINQQKQQTATNKIEKIALTHCIHV